MARTIKLLGYRLAIDMSPEFASNLDVKLEVLLSLIDIDLGSGTILKFGPMIWAPELMPAQKPLFRGGWDTFDERQLFAGTKVRTKMIYFASAEHSAKRIIALRSLRVDVPGYDAKFDLPKRSRLSRG